MKIVHLGLGGRPIPPVGFRGTEGTISDLHEALRSIGIDSAVVNPILVPGNPTASRNALQHRAPRLVRGMDYDVLHLHDARTAFFMALSRMHYVVSAHSARWALAGWTERWRFDHLRNYPFELTESLGLACADRVIAESRLTAASLPRNLWPFRLRRPVATIPIGIDTARFRSRGSGDPHVALGVGMVHPRKRWELAVRALEGTGIRLRIAGPIAVPDYAVRVQRTGPVELLGEVSDELLFREFEEAGIFVFPSETESFGVAPLQAASFARPILGSTAVPVLDDVPALSWERPADAEGFVRWMHEAALRLLREESTRRDLGRRAREAVERTFAWPVVAHRYVELYRQILDRGDRPIAERAG